MILPAHTRLRMFSLFAAKRHAHLRTYQQNSHQQYFLFLVAVVNIIYNYFMLDNYARVLSLSIEADSASRYRNQSSCSFIFVAGIRLVTVSVSSVF